MKSWKAWLLVLVIFLTGVAAGAFGMRAWVARQIPGLLRPSPGQLEERIVEHIDREVGLSEAQKAEIRPLVSEAVRKADAAHKAVREEVEGGFRAMDEAIAAKLDETQKAKFAEFRKRMEEQRRHGPPPPPPPGMGPAPDGPGMPPGPPPPPPGPPPGQ